VTKATFLPYWLRDCNAPINSKVQHPPRATPQATPPGNPPGIWTFEDSLVQIPSPRGKKAVQMPHQLLLNYLSSRQISSSIKHFTRLLERDNDTFKLLLKTLLKGSLTNKGEILSCKSVKPCKNREKLRGALRQNEINPVQIPHPSNATFKFPPPRARCTVKRLGYARGGDVEVSNWSAHKPSMSEV